MKIVMKVFKFCYISRVQNMMQKKLSITYGKIKILVRSWRLFSNNGNYVDSI